MIHSILDQDLYTLTVGQAILELYPDAEVSYQFTNRKGTKFTPTFFESLQAKIQKMKDVVLTSDEQGHLSQYRFLKLFYIQYLSNYRFDPNEVTVVLSPEGELKVTVTGLWHRTIFWEVVLLALISETYFETIDTHWNYQGQYHRISSKGAMLADAGVTFADFGTRRRRSYESQDSVVKLLKNCPGFVGTSNVHFAHKYGVKAIGTQSHQWTMGVSALESLRYANKYAMQKWNDVYQGDLGIALPDTFGTEAFFGDFDKQLARLYDGIRHDSGDPFEFARKVVKHYKSLGIDPFTKTIVFSDSLNPEKAIQLHKLCQELGIRSSFGIGTNFTNDFESTTEEPTPPLNMVIKLRRVKKNATSQYIEVVKLSDVPTKATGDVDALRVAMWTFFGTPLDRKNS